MVNDRAQNLQDTFLNHVRKAKIPLTIFLVNGVKLQGVVTWFDNFCMLLRRDGHSRRETRRKIGRTVCRRVAPGGSGQATQRSRASEFVDSQDGESVPRCGASRTCHRQARLTATESTRGRASAIALPLPAAGLVGRRPTGSRCYRYVHRAGATGSHRTPVAEL